MNILIPEKWLREHVETNATTKELQENLSLCGPSFEHTEIVKDDNVFDIEVTTNRVDACSVRGIAREAATILPELGFEATLLDEEWENSTKHPWESSELGNIDLTIENNPELCHRIICATMSVPKVTESPKWLKDKLEQVGQRPLNLLIDITNYIMWEQGHPIHVFDYDRLTEKKIIVRQAKEGETFVTLDKKKHVCNGGEVVFDDGSGTIIDLPGIMGTENTVVTNETKNILVWIESVPAQLIRKASMGLSIRTQAAVLNEKNVDPNLGLRTLQAALHKYSDLAKASMTSSIYDDFPVKPELIETILRHELIETYLGMAIESEKVERILTNLGCTIQSHGEKVEQYKVTPPTYRSHDLKIPQDYIEEIARIYGYHNLPSKLMDTPIPDIDTNMDHTFEQKIKESLAYWGANEVYCYSLISEVQAKESSYPIDEIVKLANPLSEDLVYLRPSHIPSHKEVFESNKSKTDWTIFEMSNTYSKPLSASISSPVAEVLTLTISNQLDYKFIKKLVDMILTDLRIAKIRYSLETVENKRLFIDELSAELYSNDTKLGSIGKNKLGFYNAILDVYALKSVSASHPKYNQIPTTSPIIEDLTFTLPEKTLVGNLLTSIESLDNLIVSAVHKDTYNQNQTFTVTYLDNENQLSSDQIPEVRNKIVELVKTSYDGFLVGSL